MMAMRKKVLVEGKERKRRNEVENGRAGVGVCVPHFLAVGSWQPLTWKGAFAGCWLWFAVGRQVNVIGNRSRDGS